MKKFNKYRYIYGICYLKNSIGIEYTYHTKSLNHLENRFYLLPPPPLRSTNRCVPVIITGNRNEVYMINSDVPIVEMSVPFVVVGGHVID